MADDPAHVPLTREQWEQFVTRIDWRTADAWKDKARYVERAVEAEIRLLRARQQLDEARLEAARAARLREQAEAQQPTERSPDPALPSGRSGSPGAQAGWALSDAQIKALAVRAFRRFSQLPDEQANRAWTLWKQELRSRFPPYIAAEVERYAEELRQLANC